MVRAWPIQSIYPFSKRIDTPDDSNNGYFTAPPSGVTVHYTADRDVERTIRSLKQQKLNYHLIIDRDGKVVQSCYLDKACSHAGTAFWNEQRPNKQHIAIALASWGHLTARNSDQACFAWTGQQVDLQDVVWRFGKPWDKATREQEAKLFELLCWFIDFYSILPEDICGHDECALPRGRKPDPGGVLSMSMQEYRDALAARKKVV